ncbi:hypothetical protein ACXAUS_002314 [Clostridium sporogenes]|uniref:hypothetical protein n=1 Tax=Clostridium sporogenes TaxID=1509 RepID=UPI0028FF00AB|nr:hypothetical protein [Clostridium botulinum]
MLKKCINCNNNISFKSFYIRGFFGNYYEFTCPKCGCKYKASKQSILIYFFIALAPMIVLTRLNEKWIIFLWLIIAIFLLHLLILKFEKI